MFYRLFFLFLFSFCTFSVPHVQSQTARELPLPTFRPQDLERLTPYLDRGPVLLALFRERAEDAPPIVMAVRVRAPAHHVANILRQPQHYPEFMPALDSISIEDQRPTQIAYRWSWRVALFTLAGRNVMTFYPAHPQRGYRIDVQSIGGDLGQGRMSFRIIPDGPDTSVLMLASRIDMRGANYLADQMAAGGTAVFRSINIALSTVMMLGTKRRAEHESVLSASPLTPLQRPQLDENALWPLLERGDLVFLEREGNRLSRVSVLGRTNASEERARAVMIDPEEFGQSLMQGARAEIVEESTTHVDFEWGIPLPLIRIEGRMRLIPSDGVIRVEGRAGSLRHGQWEFDTTVFPHGEAGIVGWARFDPRDTSRLIRGLIAEDHDFSHGIALATQIMVMRSLRSRIRRYRL